jgi:putative oxidoreductase
MLGFYRRIASALPPLQSVMLLACSMFVAYWTADREALSAVFSDPGKFYAADPYTFLFASLMVLIFGAGFFAVDTLVAKRLKAVEL